MAKKNSKAKRMPKPTYAFPQFHRDVLKAVSGAIHPVWVETGRNREECNNEYSTNVMGRFTCNNDSCSSPGWASKTVSILIRGYPDNGYNAIIFNQRCESCNELGHLILDKNSYVERIAYRLKKWAGFQTEEQIYNDKKGPPHMRELCEGCKRGYCQNRYG